jgi:cytochrome c5
MQIVPPLLARSALAMLLAATCACSPSGAARDAGAARAAAPDPAALEALRPADAALAAKYERACFLCHARAGSGAPLVGDAAAWRIRLAQGGDTLVAHVEQGLGGMPARGLCPDCTRDDLVALVAFLASGEAGANGANAATSTATASRKAAK